MHGLASHSPFSHLYDSHCPSIELIWRRSLKSRTSWSLVRGVRMPFPPSEFSLIVRYIIDVLLYRCVVGRKCVVFCAIRLRLSSWKLDPRCCNDDCRNWRAALRAHHISGAASHLAFCTTPELTRRASFITAWRSSSRAIVVPELNNEEIYSCRRPRGYATHSGTWKLRSAPRTDSLYASSAMGWVRRVQLSRPQVTS